MPTWIAGVVDGRQHQPDLWIYLAAPQHPDGEGTRIRWLPPL